MGERVEVPAARTFLHDLQFDYVRDGGSLRGSLTITPEMTAATGDRALVSVIATVADVFTGIPVSGNGQVALTVDLVTRMLGPMGVGTYTMESDVIKEGRSLVVTEAVVAGDDGAVAHCLATFVPFPVPDFVSGPGGGLPIGAGGLTQPFLAALGVRRVGPGVAQVDRTAYTLQPAGTIQGGTISALIEAAAADQLGGPLAELDVRFLATVKEGPARAEATALDDRTARVTVIDTGNDDRKTAIAFARR